MNPWSAYCPCHYGWAWHSTWTGMSLVQHYAPMIGNVYFHSFHDLGEYVSVLLNSQGERTRWKS